MKTKFIPPAESDRFRSNPPAPVPRTFSSRPTHAEIATRARLIWIERGRPFACDDEIWLQAERELLHSSTRAGATGPEVTLDRDGAVAGPVETSLDLVASPPERRSPTSL